ncbi:MAG: protein of unknown function DUF1828/Domain of unknown function [Acidimicrobiaceae bacterium]|nr:protein of unknown function DUF1828/Domain of unknown function [Acidimicrobiaceae bacterium]
MTQDEELKSLVDSYVAWLRRGISAAGITDDVMELSTPFMDRHNDHLQIYAKRAGDTYTLSDEGETVSDLSSSGVDVNQPRRRATIEELARGFGVNIERGRLFVTAGPGNLGQKTHALIQAMLAVNDLYVLARSRVASYFREDVEEYLLENSVRFSKRVKLAGKSGFDHSIDFLIPASSQAPERILQAVSTPTKWMVTQVLWSINDTREARSDNVTAFALLNDQSTPVHPEILEAFSNYDVKALTWADRAGLIGELAA